MRVRGMTEIANSSSLGIASESAKSPRNERSRSRSDKKGSVRSSLRDLSSSDSNRAINRWDIVFRPAGLDAGRFAGAQPRNITQNHSPPSGICVIPAFVGNQWKAFVGTRLPEQAAKQHQARGAGRTNRRR
jgi:hypothetical protein